MKSLIMKRAWEIKRENKDNIFALCLKMAWAESRKVKFENHMEVTADGYTRELSRWTKGNMDRVYINGGSKAGDGYVDLVSGRTFLRGNLTYQVKIAEMILAMQF